MIALPDFVSQSLSNLARATLVPGGVRVTTHCMYPSNGLVQVTVSAGQSTVVASDEGRGVGEVLAAGFGAQKISRRLVTRIEEQGLKFVDGVISTPPMPKEAISLAILHVANASQEVARWMFDHLKLKPSRDFKVLLADFLNRNFENSIVHNDVIAGRSDKPHTFANIISLGEGRRLIVDPVVRDPNSINSRVIANMDVKALQNPLLDQRIVYDDEDEWRPADLNLLQVGAYAVPFSKSSEVITRLAGARLRQ